MRISGSPVGDRAIDIVVVAMPEDVRTGRSVEIWIFSAVAVIPAEHPYTARAKISLISPPFRRSRLAGRSKNVADKAEPVIVGRRAGGAQRRWGTRCASRRSIPAGIAYSRIVIDGFIERGIRKRRPQSSPLVAEKRYIHRIPVCMVVVEVVSPIALEQDVVRPGEVAGVQAHIDPVVADA